MTSASPQQYELVFDGPLDESPDTLRRLKGVFISELEFTIDETIQALQKFPVTVRKGDSEQSLSRLFHMLQNAGGKVLLVSPKKEQNAEEADAPAQLEEDDLWQVEPSPSERLVDPTKDEELAPLELEFALDDIVQTSAAPMPQAAPKETKVFQLDEDANIEDALRELTPREEKVALTPPEPQKEPAPAPLQPLVVEPSLDLDIYSAPSAVELPPIETAPVDPSPWTLELEAAEPPPPPPVAADPAPKTTSAQEFLLSSFAETPAVETPPQVQATTVPPPPVAAHDPLTLDLTAEAPEPPATTTAQTVAPLTLDLEPEPPEIAASEEKVSVAPQISAQPALQTESVELGEAAKPPAPVAEEKKTTPMVEAPPVIAEQRSPVISQSSVEQETTPTKKGRKILGMQSDLFVPILIGAVILGAANWWAFNSSLEAPEVSLSMVPDIKTAQDNSDAPPVPKVPAPMAQSYVGTGSFSGMPSDLRITGVGDKVRTVKLSFVPAAPRELTPEEIVGGVLRDPVVKRVEINDLRITNLPDGSFEGRGPARLIVDDNGAKRSVNPAFVSGRWNSATGAFSGHLEIRLVPDAGVPPQPFSIQRLEMDRYDVLLSADMEMALTVEHPESAVSSEAKSSEPSPAK